MENEGAFEYGAESFTDDTPDSKYTLILYVTGLSPKSKRAIQAIKEICETHLQGRYELKVIDLYQHPDLARDEQIIAAPTLVKKLPLPLRKIVGDMSDEEKLLVGLGLFLQTD